MENANAPSLPEAGKFGTAVFERYAFRLKLGAAF
jgi:hypothetical protein